MKIGKQEAASRQLDVAIELLFEDRDILAVFTVGNAASVILSELVEARNPKTNWDQVGSEANGLPLATWFKAIRKTPNFLKHARNDPDAYEEIEDPDVDHILFIACLNLGSLLESSQQLSKTQSVFQLWYFMRYSKELLESGEARLSQLIDSARQVVGELPNGRNQAIRIGASLLAHNV